MTFINYASREINCKIVYYGPGLWGKTRTCSSLRQDEPQRQGQAHLPCHGDRPNAFLRLPASGAGHRPGVQDTVPPLHRPRPGVLRREPEAHPEGCRRHRIRGRQPGRAPRREPRIPRQPRPQPEAAGIRPGERALRPAAQQTGPAVGAHRRGAKKNLVRDREPVIEAVASKGVGVFDTLRAVAKLVLQELTKAGS